MVNALALIVGIILIIIFLVWVAGWIYFLHPLPTVWYQKYQLYKKHYGPPFNCLNNKTRDAVGVPDTITDEQYKQCRAKMLCNMFKKFNSTDDPTLACPAVCTYSDDTKQCEPAGAGSLKTKTACESLGYTWSNNTCTNPNSIPACSADNLTAIQTEWNAQLAAAKDGSSACDNVYQGPGLRHEVPDEWWKGYSPGCVNSDGKAVDCKTGDLISNT